MPTGLRLPMGVNANGGSAIVDSEENDRKIIFTALGSNENENAFQQDVGLGDEMVFDMNDPTVRARILRRLTMVFDDFTRLKRYKLIRNTIEFATDSDAQELILDFKYLNLESDEEKTFTRTFSRGS